MSLTTRVLLALVAGLALGAGIGERTDGWATTLLAVLGPLGTIFINAIRMTVVPLVVASLIVGVTSAPDTRTVGRLGARAVALFAVFSGLAALFGVVLGAPLLAMIPLDPAAVASLRASAATTGATAAETAKSIPGLGDWILALVPANPIRAAADGAMLPLIVTTVLFAAALMRIEAARRASVVRIAEGVMDASLALVRAILDLAPIGVFALAVPLAARMGGEALGAILGYVGISVLIFVLFWVVVLYPAAVLLGGVDLRTFARATLPAQSIAFSSRSSLAALPALLESVRDTLKLPPAIGSFMIPLAVTLFRCGAGIGQTVGVLFVARLYGIDLGIAALATIAVTSLVTSFSVPGVPGGSVIVMVPVLMAAGIPVDGIGILLGADTIPDMFRTTTNVVGHMSAAAILGRAEERAASGIAASRSTKENGEA